MLHRYAKPPRRTRNNARIGSNGRRPVRGCSNRTSVAARLFLRTTDGKSHETVHSAMWQRAATGRTRVLPIRPRGHTPGCGYRRRPCPLPLSPGIRGAHRKRAPAINAVAENAALTASAPIAGGRITDMVCFVKPFDFCPAPLARKRTKILTDKFRAFNWRQPRLLVAP